MSASTSNSIFNKPNRDVHSVFIHCSASDSASHDSVATMESWHLKRGFSGVGYHFFIRKNGTLEVGRNIEQVPAAQKGHNTGSIAICLHGLEVDAFTEEQFKTLRSLCHSIQDSYTNRLKFRGHCEVSNKTCPVFDYKAVLNIDGSGYLSANSSSQSAVSSRSRAPSSNSGFPLSPSSKGTNVLRLQTYLKALGAILKLDGIFGQETREALIKFQCQLGFNPTGECDARQLEDFVAIRQGERGEKVKALQRNLVALGLTVSVDGAFGPKTTAAVKKFQSKNGLIADGVYGPRTRTKMATLLMRVGVSA